VLVESRVRSHQRKIEPLIGLEGSNPVTSLVRPTSRNRELQLLSVGGFSRTHNKIIESQLAILAALVVATAMAWAGSQGGVAVAGLPLFALAGAFAFLVQWVVFVPSYRAVSFD